LSGNTILSDATVSSDVVFRGVAVCRLAVLQTCSCYPKKRLFFGFTFHNGGGIYAV
jgi:hypothetical protein